VLASKELLDECEAKLKELVAAETTPVVNAELVQKLKCEWNVLHNRLMKGVIREDLEARVD
jgi:hypothetical protein